MLTTDKPTELTFDMIIPRHQAPALAIGDELRILYGDTESPARIESLEYWDGERVRVVAKRTIKRRLTIAVQSG
jgi:hypothetical protein